MRWIHDTGFGPAYRHEGSPLTVLATGALVPDLRDVGDRDQVVGWRAGCGCGWRSPSTYTRAGNPSPTGEPPAAVIGQVTGTGAWAEWRHHLFAAVPALILADVVRISMPPRTDVLTHPMVAAVVDIVRGRGVSWAAVAEAAGVSVHDARAAWALPPDPRLDPRHTTRREVPRRSATAARIHNPAPPRPVPGEVGPGCTR